MMRRAVPIFRLWIVPLRIVAVVAIEGADIDPEALRCGSGGEGVRLIGDDQIKVVPMACFFSARTITISAPLRSLAELAAFWVHQGIAGCAKLGDPYERVRQAGGRGGGRAHSSTSSALQKRVDCAASVMSTPSRSSMRCVSRPASVTVPSGQ